MQDPNIFHYVTITFRKENVKLLAKQSLYNVALKKHLKTLRRTKLLFLRVQSDFGTWPRKSVLISSTTITYTFYFKSCCVNIVFVKKILYNLHSRYKKKGCHEMLDMSVKSVVVLWLSVFLYFSVLVTPLLALIRQTWILFSRYK